MLSIECLTKTYKGGAKAVDNLSLTVEAGDIFGFIGHNGAGKTTTIKAVVGVLDFDSGEIFIDTLSIKKNPLACKQITAYIPDNPDLYGHLTGIQYLNFIANIFQLSNDARDERIKHFSDRLELTTDLGDLIAGYSHGMKQKLALIGAFMHQPKLLVLDEPFVGLDPKASHTLKQMMKELCDQGGAIFFSTHVLEVAEILCNKIAIIKSGRLISIGTTQQVRGDSSLEEIFLELTDEK